MRLNTRFLAIALLALPTTFQATQRAGAYPSNSPSAKAAARLKYNPPQNWIRHYLGDDRYKIEGSVWQVVSTHTDTYYHRADCPNMLKQSADIVIGFNKSSEAVVDGYQADPTCQPDASAYIYSGPDTNTPVAGRNIKSTITNRDKKSKTILLADGKSTIGLPAGWTRLPGSRTDVPNGFFCLDILQPPTKKGQVFIVTASLPGLDVSAITDEKKTREGMKMFSQFAKQTGMSKSNFEKINDLATNVTITPIKLGGLDGIVISPPKNKTRLGGLGRSWFAGKGETFFAIDDFTRGAPGVSTLVSTYRPR